MPEFLNTYDPQHALLLIEEDFWTDAEVEEFWSGWVEYSNRMKLRCPCGAARWENVEFTIDDAGTNLGAEMNKAEAKKQEL